MLEAYLFTLIGVVSAQLAPGPNLMAVASAAMDQGRRSGLCVTSGIASGMLIWSLASAFGLSALVAAYPSSLSVLKLVGGSYLIWMGGRALRSAWLAKSMPVSTSTSTRSDIDNWLYGLFVVLTNPKAAMMWIAVATFLFGADLNPLQVMLFGPLGAISGCIVYGMYAVLFSTRPAQIIYQRGARYLEGMFALSFGAMGGKLLWDGARELKP